MKGRIACSIILAAVATHLAADVKADAFDDYKIARQAEKNGEFGRSASGYENVGQGSAPLRKYADRRLALLARSTGNLMLERIVLLRSQMSSAGDASAVSRRLAENAYESGNNAETIRILTAAASKPTPSRDDSAHLANAYLANGDRDKARTLYSALVASGDAAAPDEAALISVRGLDSLDGGPPAAIPEEEHLKRAAIYQANREFEQARMHFKAVVDTGGAAAADCLLQIGRGYASSSDPAEAVTWFERVLEQYPVSTAAKDALLQAASMYARVGKSHEAIKRYQRFIEMYPNDEKLDRAYLNLVDVTRDLGADQEALKWCEKTETAFNGKPQAAVAIFAAARIHFARGDAKAALGELDRLKDVTDLGRAVPGGTDRTEVDLLRGIALEKLGRFQEAVDVYLSVPARSYYGLRADERLRQLSSSDNSRGFVDQKAGTFAAMLRAKDPSVRRSAAIALLRLSRDAGTRENALEALRDTLKTKANKPETRETTDATASRLIALGLGDDVFPGGLARHSITTIGSTFQNAPPDTPVDAFPSDDIRQLYPIAYEDMVKASSARYGVDPRFVLAIMRQESGFDPFAHSGASARGLMQLIVSTAVTTAAETGRKAVTENDLFDPATSIDLGARHIADLFRLFPEKPEAVAAAYNAGEDNVGRWVSRSKSNAPDAYVPEIMFVQTKDYVGKVMTNYQIYQTLYAEDLTAR